MDEAPTGIGHDLRPKVFSFQGITRVGPLTGGLDEKAVVDVAQRARAILVPETSARR